MSAGAFTVRVRVGRERECGAVQSVWPAKVLYSPLFFLAVLGLRLYILLLLLLLLQSFSFDCKLRRRTGGEKGRKQIVPM